VITSGTDIKDPNHAKRYFRETLKVGDYYLEQESTNKSDAKWQGSEISRLGLSEGDDIEQKDFYKLVENKKPDGEKLTERNRNGRRIGLDFTFSPPKSISLAYEMGGKDGKGDKRLLEAVQKAVSKTLELFERDAKIRDMNSRAGINTNNLVIAKFTHHHSRPLEDGRPDPQLHTHCFVINASYDKNRDKWYAVDLGHLKRKENVEQKYQPYFWKILREEVEKLGYKTVSTGKNFEIEGVSRELIEKFSRRESKISKEAEKKGLNAKQKGRLGAKNREKKNEVISQEELHKYWYDRLSEQEIKALKNLMNSEDNDAQKQISQEQQREQANQAHIQHLGSIYNQNNKSVTGEKKQETKRVDSKGKTALSRDKVRSDVTVHNSQYLTLQRNYSNEFKVGQIIQTNSKNEESRTYKVTAVDNKKKSLTLENNLGRQNTVQQQDVRNYPKYDQAKTTLKEGDKIRITQGGNDRYRPLSHKVHKDEVYKVMKQPENAQNLHVQSVLDPSKKIVLDKQFGTFEKINMKDNSQHPKQNQYQNTQAKDINQSQSKNIHIQAEQTKSQQANANKEPASRMVKLKPPEKIESKQPELQAQKQAIDSSKQQAALKALQLQQSQKNNNKGRER
jgi:conjugative relaxase-like TrwC/TraI family protein